MLLQKRSAKRKKKKGGSALLHAARWLAALFVAGFLTWALFVPESSGVLGQAVYDVLYGLIGAGAYLIPAVLFYGLYWYYRTEDTKGLISLCGGALLTLAAFTVFIGAGGVIFEHPQWGGWIGSACALRLTDAIGKIGTLFACIAAGLLGLQILFGISWIPLFQKTFRMLLEDYRSWRKTRAEFQELIAQAAKKHLPESPKSPRIAKIPEPAKRPDAVVINAPAEEQEQDEDPEPEVISPPILPPQGRSADAPSTDPKVQGAKALPGDKPYVLPPLDLLPPVNSEKETGRPSEAEIKEAISSLENALANFKIEAKVVGVCPGPVITRYEVSPAPGVKVSTITARANDIALAMKARTIRMIAPIPGKAAIGIEVPNQRPAVVSLRSIMESTAMPKDGAPLAFALGLSSEGIPLTADIQTMPHVLVAGATNSGKSVMVHSIIASILFRQRPDQVKFMLIDPKRIELTMYDGIPHLYDPKLPPDQVEVITTAKKAAGALKALVQEMDDRLEKYQVWKARNIQQFNREAAKRGEKGDFYIVCVIDELADLMIVARDVVEDSIQRLTQMARAVGIHLVIATQRPSVDVVTGVIKANLPSRIAMRVASKIDSKVVLDTNGAESLLGRGDALYVSAGTTPSRIQGSFVSTGEIGKLVAYVKTQAKPDYPILEHMAAAVAEADLAAFGVEPLQFTQALKLVLERKRVSQDLLKSQFGSSARATNMLSLLEVKGFIHKPEGTNRWNIHFEKIEDHIRKHYPQVNLDKPGI